MVALKGTSPSSVFSEEMPCPDLPCYSHYSSLTCWIIFENGILLCTVPSSLLPAGPCSQLSSDTPDENLWSKRCSVPRIPRIPKLSLLSRMGGSSSAFSDLREKEQHPGRFTPRKHGQTFSLWSFPFHFQIYFPRQHRYGILELTFNCEWHKESLYYIVIAAIDFSK